MSSVKNTSSRKHARRIVKYQLLLDESVPVRKHFPRLNELHNVIDIVELKLSGAKDEVVYRKACQLSRILITSNVKDFKNFIKDDLPTVIGLSKNMLNSEADSRLCARLKRMNNGEIKGKLINVVRGDR